MGLWSASLTLNLHKTVSIHSLVHLNSKSCSTWFPSLCVCPCVSVVYLWFSGSITSLWLSGSLVESIVLCWTGLLVFWMVEWFSDSMVPMIISMFIFHFVHVVSLLHVSSSRFCCFSAAVGGGQVQREQSGWGQGVGGAGVDERQMRSPLMIIESFLSALTSADKDGRIVVTKTGTQAPFKS